MDSALRIMSGRLYVKSMPLNRKVAPVDVCVLGELQTIVTDVRGVCLSVCPSVCLSRRLHELDFTVPGHSVQPSPITLASCYQLHITESLGCGVRQTIAQHAVYRHHRYKQAGRRRGWRSAKSHMPVKIHRCRFGKIITG